MAENEWEGMAKEGLSGSVPTGLPLRAAVLSALEDFPREVAALVGDFAECFAILSKEGRTCRVHDEHGVAQLGDYYRVSPRDPQYQVAGWPVSDQIRVDDEAPPIAGWGGVPKHIAALIEDPVAFYRSLRFSTEIELDTFLHQPLLRAVSGGRPVHECRQTKATLIFGVWSFSVRGPEYTTGFGETTRVTLLDAETPDAYLSGAARFVDNKDPMLLLINQRFKRLNEVDAHGMFRELAVGSSLISRDSLSRGPNAPTRLRTFACATVHSASRLVLFVHTTDGEVWAPAVLHDRGPLAGVRLWANAHGWTIRTFYHRHTRAPSFCADPLHR